MGAVRVDRIAALSDPDALGSLVGPVASVERAPMVAAGFSGSVHERLAVRLASGAHRRLVLKRTRLSEDWTAYRTGDVLGREAALLSEPRLASVWDVFACPYLAWAIEDGEVGLLSDDLSAHLFPDLRAPIAETAEDALLGALASLHARFWESAALALPWLARLPAPYGLLGPRSGEEEARRGSTNPLFERVRAGWAAAFRRLPQEVADLLRTPPEDLARACAGVPHTVLHGDVKVANFALLPDRRVAAFDWAVVAAAPATLDLGWYLSVNASRLARPKEAVIARYRGLLEAALGEPLGDDLWERVVGAGLLYGGVTLLWSKALAADTGAPAALAEWEWWVANLARLAM